MTRLYEIIKELCKEKKLSIRQLEVNLDLPTNTISDWRIKLPSGDRLLNVSYYFDVSVDYLIGNTNNRFSHKILYSASSIKLIEASEQLKLCERETEVIIKMMYILKTQYDK